MNGKLSHYPCKTSPVEAARPSCRKSLSPLTETQLIPCRAANSSSAATSFLHRGLLLLLLSTVIARSLSAAPDSETSFYYNLDSHRLSAQQRNQLQHFVKQSGRQSYYLVEGYACNQGGYDISYKIAEMRSQDVMQLLLTLNIAKNSIHQTEGIVLYGKPYSPHRRVRLRRFPSLDHLQSAWQEARLAAQQHNRHTRQQLGLSEEPSLLYKRGLDKEGAEENMATGKTTEQERVEQERVEQEEIEQEGVERENIAEIPLWPMMLGAAIIALFGLLLYKDDLISAIKKRREPAKTAIEQRKEEPSSPSPLVTNSLPSVGKKAPFQSIGNISQLLEKTRSRTTMATKTSTATSSIANVLEPSFANRSFRELCNAPVHALMGLTPRHGRLLEEAFGVSTIEELARLKYVEIAKAITVLAQYEEKSD